MRIEKINIMLPTYKRPARLRRFLDSVLRTASNVDNLCLTLCVNERDEETKRALSEWYIPCPLRICYEKTEQPNLAAYFNQMYEETSDYTDAVAVSMFGDDMHFETQGWDQRFIDILNESEGRAVVYGDDAYIAHDKLCVHLVVSRETVRATGMPFMCPIYKADMIDVVWYLYGKMTGSLRYLPDVVIRHEHDSRLPQDRWDETMLRLAPVRYESNSADVRRVANLYATLMAGAAIDEGRAKWADLP